MPERSEPGWSFPVANGHLGPRALAMLIEAVSGHHVTERQIAQWAIHNGEVTLLPGAGEAAEARYAMTARQAVETLNELGRQYGMDSELRFASVADLESESRHRALTIEIGDADSGAPTRFVVLSAFDPPGNAVAIGDPGSTDPPTETIPLSSLERAWAASNGALIMTSGGSEAGPALLPVVIEPRLVHAA